MHIYSCRRERIELEEVTFSPAGGLRAAEIIPAGEPARDLTVDAERISRAAVAHFQMDFGLGRMAAAEAAAGPLPAVFRDGATGLLRAVYREIVVRFKPGVKKPARKGILDKYGFAVRRVSRAGNHVVYDPARKYSHEKLIEVANDWAAMDEVLFAAPNFVSQYVRDAAPAIPAPQWHLRNRARSAGQVAGEDVKAADAWKISRGKPSIVVAVLDDGVDIDHPNLKSRIWRNPDQASPDRFGRDFFVPDNHPEHFNPRPKLFRFPFNRMTGNDIHGTPCAGVIAAAGKSGGAVGVAPRCRILPVKVFHADDLAADERVADAIRYAASIAHILSCSWSGPASPDIEQALEDIGANRGGKGVAVFCATGNEERNRVGFPARDANAIAVGASTDQARRASYSNYGPEVSVVAPSSGGVAGVFTTDVSIHNRGFNVGDPAAGGADGLHTNDFGGTSSATPLAAGVGALVLSVRPDLTRAQLKDLLQRTADKIASGYGANGHSEEYGFGRVNAARALQEAKSLPH